MKTVKIKGNTYRGVWIKAITKVADGWRMISPIKKSFLGYYFVKLEINEVP